jgi:hypothetical protein
MWNLIKKVGEAADAALAIDGRHVYQIGPTLSRCASLVICPESTGRQDHGALFLERLSTSRACSNTSALLHKQFVGMRLRDDAGIVAPLRNLLDHLNERVNDRYTWQSHLPTVRARLRLATRTCDHAR